MSQAVSIVRQKPTPLPSFTPPVLWQAIDNLSRDRREAFIEHLFAGTGADYLSDWISRAGHPVGATTIKTFRQRLRREEQA